MDLIGLNGNLNNQIYIHLFWWFYFYASIAGTCQLEFDDKLLFLYMDYIIIITAPNMKIC